MKNGIIVLCLVCISLTACNHRSISFTPSLDKQIGQRKDVLQDTVSRINTHIAEWNVIAAFTHALDDSSATYQSKIDSILVGPAREAYTAERDAFSRWYGYQNVVAEDVVQEIWEFYIGGTFGGTLYVMHLYDRANANMTEQEILFNALTNKAYASLYQPSATMEDIRAAKDHLVAQLMSQYSSIDKENDLRYLVHTADEVEELISKDFSLFQEWISARKTLEALLNPDVSNIFSSQTGYWQDMFLQTLREKYIHESD